MSANKISILLLSKELEEKHSFFSEHKHLQSKLKLYKSIEKTLFEKSFLLSEDIQIYKNLNLKNLNKELERNGISTLKDNDLQKSLNKLLNYRNATAHGEDNKTVTNDEISMFSEALLSVLDLVHDKVIDAFQNESYSRVQE